MPVYVLKNTKGTILFKAAAPSLKACVEKAVHDGIALEGAQLAHLNLADANLDGACLRGADLRGANLTGANLSESCLDQALLDEASLYNACLCEASLVSCRMRNASFGGTDIAGAVIRDCIFSGSSAFTLNFIDCAQMSGCFFEDLEGNRCPFSHPPIVILGLARTTIFMDNHVRIGNRTASYASWMGSLREYDKNHPDAGPLFQTGNIAALARAAITARRQKERREKSACLTPPHAACGQGD